MADEPIKPDPEKKPKRPRDANQLAKMVVDLATGETQEPDPKQDSEAAKRGSMGGNARAEALTPEERSRIAKEAAKARWSDG